MSVICKVYITDVRQFGEEKLVKTNCVAENEVMAAYNPDHEDKLFSQYSPSGLADFTVPQCIPLPDAPGQQNKLYLVFVRQTPAPKFAKAIAYAPITIRSFTNFGGTSNQFDMGTPYAPVSADYRCLKQFGHRIMIDNPGASDQFVPQQTDWWVGIYDAAKYTMTETLADAHA